MHEVADGSGPAEQVDASPEPEIDSGNIPNGDQLAALTDAVDGLTEQVRGHHARAEARERVIDRLHAEVQRLKAGERSLALRPISTDLQNLRTDLLRQAETLPGEVTRTQAAELLESFALSVELTLERCGIVPIRPEPGVAFSARRHRAVKVLPAITAEQDETVAEVVADGYHDTATDRVSQPARVRVWRWTAPDPATVEADDGNEQEQTSG